MAAKELDHTIDAANSQPAPVALLEFGRLLHNEGQRPVADRNPTRLQQVEAQLINRLTTKKNSLLKPALNFNAGKPIDALGLRVLAAVAFHQLCTKRLVVTVSEVVQAVAGNDPAQVLDTRRIVSRLLIAKQLILKPYMNGCLALGEVMLNFLAGGKEATPITLTEFELDRRWRKAEALAAKRQAKASFEKLPSAKQLAAMIAKDVIGLDAQVRTLACRLTLQQRRAALLRANQDPGSPNEVMLFIGPSGCGKTWLAESAGKICGLPYAAISATDLTCEGYVGLSVDDGVKQLISAADGDPEKARWGVLLLDEWDKKASAGLGIGSRDVAGSSVQQAVLRLIEGCDFTVGGRRGSIDWTPTPFNSRGTCFMFAGAFVGLEQLLGKHTAHGIGFGGQQPWSQAQQFLYDALVDFGMIPEFVNRLSGVLVFPAPMLEQLIEIATRSVIPSYRKLLASCGADIQLTDDAIRVMADCVLTTKTFARGIKTIVARLIEEAVYEERKGTVQLGVGEVRQAIQSAGLGAINP